MSIKRKAVISGALFIASFIVTLLIWIKFKTYYGSVVANIGAHLAALTTGCLVEGVKSAGEKAVCTFLYQALTVKGPAALHFQAVLYVSKYSYNVPLTLSLIAALYPWIRPQFKSVAEALALVFFIHLSYVFFFCSLKIYYAFVKAGVKEVWKAEQFFWEYSWAFINGMVIRFEPFLIGAFLWFKELRIEGRKGG